MQKKIRNSKKDEQIIKTNKKKKNTHTHTKRKSKRFQREAFVLQLLVSNTRERKNTVISRQNKETAA